VRSKRIIRIALAVTALFGAAFLGWRLVPSSRVPNPWGSIRFVHYATNSSVQPNDSRLMATFEFTSCFPWPVIIQAGTVTKATNGWPSQTGPGIPLPGVVAPGATSTFDVQVPRTTGAWRPYLHSHKAELTDGDRRRLRLREWFSKHHMSIVSDRISADCVIRFVSDGPEMHE
jgi:hypothetical protein